MKGGNKMKKKYTYKIFTRGGKTFTYKSDMILSKKGFKGSAVKKIKRII